MRSEAEVVLFAVLGMSPSVLTETVWALACENPPLLPSRVVVLTTSAGRAALLQHLFQENGPHPCGWDRLQNALKQRGLDLTGRLKFGVAFDHIRLFPAPDGNKDLADIATSADNAAAADFILRELRAFTENPATTVLASIAGGRKTMGALLMSCMSLLGRKQDRVLHVLVNPPFDTPLDPAFLFPEEKMAYKTKTGQLVNVRPKIDLIDVPFAKMRGWYEGTFKSSPPSYAALIKGIQRQAPAPKTYPNLTVDRKNGRLLVNGRQDAKLSATEFAALTLLLGDAGTLEAIVRVLHDFKALALVSATPEWQHALKESSRFSTADALDDLRKTLSSARNKIKSMPELSLLVDSLIPLRGRTPSYPSGKIKWTGPDPFADIRG